MEDISELFRDAQNLNLILINREDPDVKYNPVLQRLKDELKEILGEKDLNEKQLRNEFLGIQHKNSELFWKAGQGRRKSRPGHGHSRPRRLNLDGYDSGSETCSSLATNLPRLKLTQNVAKDEQRRRRSLISNGSSIASYSKKSRASLESHSKYADDDFDYVDFKTELQSKTKKTTLPAITNNNKVVKNIVREPYGQGRIMFDKDGKRKNEIHIHFPNIERDVTGSDTVARRGSESRYEEVTQAYRSTAVEDEENLHLRYSHGNNSVQTDNGFIADLETGARWRRERSGTFTREDSMGLVRITSFHTEGSSCGRENGPKLTRSCSNCGKSLPETHSRTEAENSNIRCDNCGKIAVNERRKKSKSNVEVKISSVDQEGTTTLAESHSTETTAGVEGTMALDDNLDTGTEFGESKNYLRAAAEQNLHQSEKPNKPSKTNEIEKLDFRFTVQKRKSKIDQYREAYIKALSAARGQTLPKMSWMMGTSTSKAFTFSYFQLWPNRKSSTDAGYYRNPIQKKAKLPPMKMIFGDRNPDDYLPGGPMNPHPGGYELTNTPLPGAMKRRTTASKKSKRKSKR